MKIVKEDKTIAAITIVALLLIGVLSIAPITAVEEGDAGYLLSAAGTVWSASQTDLVGVGIGVVGMHVAIAGAIICPPVGAAAAGVIL